MSMETAITRAWQRQAAWLWLLLPLSWLYGLVSRVRRYGYRAGVFKSYRAPIPVMVIGNITVGGSGKTPLIINLVSHLQQRGIDVGVISRGYGGDSAQMPALVTASSQPNVVGDEPCLIVSMTSVPMAVCPDRRSAISLLLEAHPKLQLIIADDGLQHYALARDIEWIVVDSTRGFGNQQLLPTGFLREPVSRLQDATVIYHKKGHEVSPTDNEELSKEPLVMRLQPDRLHPILQGIGLVTTEYDKALLPQPSQTVHAVSGIGYPQRFFNTLSESGFEVIPHPYPDHHDFLLDELLPYTQQPIVMTSKDAIKIRALIAALYDAKGNPTAALTPTYQALIERLFVLPVTAVLSEPCYEVLDDQLNDLSVLS